MDVGNDPHACLDAALAADAAFIASAPLAQRDQIGLAGFSRHLEQMRFMPVGVAAGRIDQSDFVWRGRGPDQADSGFVRRSSHGHASPASSGGSALNGDTNRLKRGRSRQCHGPKKDPDTVFAQAVTIHGPDRVDSETARQHGRIGRSRGCFALERREIGEVRARLGPDRMVFVADRSRSLADPCALAATAT